MTVRFENIPPQLTSFKQFVLWRLEMVNERPVKVPYQARDGRVRAATNDPRTWSTLQKVRVEFEQRPRDFSGIGFVFTEQDEFVGIDLDKCRDPKTGQMSEVATEVIQRCNSYTEVSPSGTGVKIFAGGARNLKLPRKRGKYRDLNVEIYKQGRYFTLTGERLLNLPADVQSRREQVEQLSTSLVSANGKTRAVSTPSAPLGSSELSRVLTRLREVQGGPSQFKALCPAHHDTRPSLSIGIGDKGQVLLHCFRGCNLQAILQRLDLQTRDLFPAQPMLANRRNRKEV